MFRFLMNPITGDQTGSNAVIFAIVGGVCLILLVLLILWPKFSKKASAENAVEESTATKDETDHKES